MDCSRSKNVRCSDRNAARCRPPSDRLFLSLAYARRHSILLLTMSEITLDIFPSAPLSSTPISPLIYSGFLEHLGRCIYGGILPSTPTTFPYTPRNPAPTSSYKATPPELLTQTGFRKDVLGLLRDELKVPMVRWPGGNYVSSYRWEDGIGPKEVRVRRMELAWGGEESNLFGTDE